MVEWWQALLLLGAGGLLGVGSSYVQRWWSVRDVEEAEERGDRRRIREEERRTARQLRRERVEPILDWLAKAKGFSASATLDKVIEGWYEQGDAAQKEEMQTLARKELGEVPNIIHLVHGLPIAVSTASTGELQRAILAVFGAVLDYASGKKGSDFYAKVRGAEELVEQYVAKVSLGES